MWEEILKQAVENGLWAVLFCCLLAYLLKDGRAREAKYQQTIERLCEHLEVVEDIKDAVGETLKAVKSKRAKESSAAKEVNDKLKNESVIKDSL